MAGCKCFDKKPSLDGKSFKDDVEKCKCLCGARFTASENKRQFRVEPAPPVGEVDKIKVDGYLFDTNDFKKCDYVFVVNKEKDTETYIFVELKGEDVTRAVQQIANTINIFWQERMLDGVIVRGALAFSTFPKNTSSFRNAYSGLIKLLAGKIKEFEFGYKKNTIKYNPQTNRFL